MTAFQFPSLKAVWSCTSTVLFSAGLPYPYDMVAGVEGGQAVPGGRGRANASEPEMWGEEGLPKEAKKALEKTDET
jgi:hypothetical protein